MNAYDLAIFDFDGTLADSAEWFFAAYDAVAVRFGLRRASRVELEGMRALGTREIMRSLDVPMWKVPLIARHMRRRMADEIGGITLFPGIADALVALHGRGVRLAIVSSNAEGNVRAVLGEALAGRVAFWGCGTALFGKAKKLRQAMRACGATPGRTIAIGDETRDVEAARAVGIASGAVLWGYAAPVALVAAGPTVVLREVGELAAL
ncbi:HAD hydrolase-like protein [Sphingomonas sp. AR_OL41]|uniref:HAD hydrolase-like protein n=1 Tax=Sphingomonas sp. AR_OL41 TaxID=3042729 RepID=UPI00248125DF|nr:HAD hydrolase-like protein [Sphingomonas sp. AR_OL41]MDH7975624.1 HAD hydrolase-like protein [Sphingomonas sp. AR_OL41]